MVRSIQILKSKIRPPVVSGIISRKRLYPLLSRIAEKALTVVSAGAGFGKTTLISEAGQVLHLKSAWYRLEKSDNDFVTLLTYMIAAIQTQYPQFGRKTILKMETAEHSIHVREAVLAGLINEMEEAVTDELMLVFDDYHLIKNSEEIKRTMEFILMHLPRNIHLVIISRTDPGLAISRLRAGREVVDIRETDLNFTLTETKELYSDWSGPVITEEYLKIVLHQTGGWISGLILFYHSIRDKGAETIDQLLKIKTGGKFVSNYLEENIYELQPPQIRHFLIQTAILARIHPEFSDLLLGISNSRNILENLEKNHLFTFSLDDGREWFAYHHLFQEFLLTKLHADMDSDAIKAIHHKAAELWQQKAEPDQALAHYLKSEDFKTATAMLTRIGRDYIKEGRIQLLISFIHQMPKKIIEHQPWILFSKAVCLEFQGKREESVPIYHKALHVFRKKLDYKGEGKALFALATCYYTTGDFSQAETILTELLAKTEKDPQLSVNTLGSLAFIASHQGRMQAADGYIARAESIFPRLSTRAGFVWLYFNQGFRYCFAGDFTKGLGYGNEIERICRIYGLENIRAYNFHLISWSYYHLGLFSEGLQHAQSGLALVQARGYFDLSRAWLLTDAALNLLGLEKQVEAQKKIEEAITIFKDQGSRWGESWALHVLFDIYQSKGDMIAAEQCARSGIERIRGMKLPLQEGKLKKRLMICLQKKGLSDEVSALSGDIRKLLENTQLYVDGPPRSQTDSVVPESRPSIPKPGLRIYLLGEFKLLRGNEEIPIEKWKSKKALMLFKYLASRRHHGYIPKDLLMELLWPDQSPDMTNSRLNDALSALRKVLEPGLIRGKPSSYLLREGHSYKLDLGEDGMVDAALFEQTLQAAENEISADQALSIYQEAEALYRGDFLEEDPYTEWCLAERDRLKDIYLRLLTKIMEAFEQKSDYPKAAAYGEKFLQIDPYAEEIYQHLMRQYARMGNRSMIKRTFEKCKKMLTQDLDVPLSPKTNALYREFFLF